MAWNLVETRIDYLGVSPGTAGHDETVPLLGLPVGAQITTIQKSLQRSIV
jgi:hypothetical protein